MHRHTLCPSLVQLLILHKPSVPALGKLSYDGNSLVWGQRVTGWVTHLTCWHDDPLLICGAAGRGGRLGAHPRLRVRGLVRHRGPVVAHVSGALGDTAVHRGLAARRDRGDSIRSWTMFCFWNRGGIRSYCHPFWRQIKSYESTNVTCSFPLLDGNSRNVSSLGFNLCCYIECINWIYRYTHTQVNIDVLNLYMWKDIHGYILLEDEGLNIFLRT